MISWLKQSWLVLLLAGSLGTTLAVVQRSLQGRIERNARERLERAVLTVIPGGKHSQVGMMNGQVAWQVFDEHENELGWAVATETSGFSDRIRLMIGVTSDRSKILGVAVLASRETPGLGERIREAAFLEQFRGQRTETILRTVKPGQSAEQPIDAISGATISSQAVVRAVNRCMQNILTKGLTDVDAITGAKP